MKLTTVALVLSTAGIAAEVPKTWDERALADWATPVAGLNVRPGHFSEREYYAAPVDNLRTYPAFVPPTNSLRTANLLYQVDNGPYAGAQPVYRIIMTEAERICDEIAIIERGSILAKGSVDSLRQSNGGGSLEDVFVSTVDKVFREEAARGEPVRP